MSVRHSLLALLTLGPCYGYQLRAEYERRTGAARSLNVGQIYNTLERLERDGLVATAETDAQGHVYYRITDAGRTAARDWLGSASPELDLDALAAKIALAASLPEGAQAAIAAERDALVSPPAASGAPEDAEAMAAALAASAASAAAHGRADWLDAAERMLREHPVPPLPLAPTRPRRGRPLRAATPDPGTGSET
ncbi:PadR family transcriptional regulator [Microbacterium sp. GXF7504]